MHIHVLSDYKWIRNILFMLVTLLMSPFCVYAQDAEPIAYIGHGAFFDESGEQIQVTQEFVATAQRWYIDNLSKDLDSEGRREFRILSDKLIASTKASGQEELVVQQHLLQWLITTASSLDARTRGILNALKFAIQWKLPDTSDTVGFKFDEIFQIDLSLSNILNAPEFDPGDVQVFSATMNLGQAYLNECEAAGVPIPPPINEMDPAGLAGWKSLGFIPPGDLFIEVANPAEVRIYESTSPPGMCIALPRYVDQSLNSVLLDGVICLGETTSNVCFWDNQMNGQGFVFGSNERIPIGVPDTDINPAGRYQAGGFELEGGTGGVCSNCHAGENPYIVHPKTDLGAGSGPEMEDLDDPPLNLPTFSQNRYDPLVPASWPQNELSHSPALVPDVCSNCHVTGGVGGAFPHLSNELQMYCGTVLAQAINRTMPPNDPGSEANNPDVLDFLDWCGVGPNAGPSGRGDPHLTTTNEIKYDFQSAGEFTALRNSGTGFELQTRQTGVSTTFNPGPNSHTGLASCVSLNTATAFRLGKHRVTYQPENHSDRVQRLQLRIDGKRFELSKEGINLGNGNTITKTAIGGGLEVNMSDGTKLIITSNYWASQGYWYLNIEVLNTSAREGTMGHIKKSDWLPLSPSGSSFGPAPASLDDRHFLLNEKFADAWRVSDSNSLFDYELGTSTKDFTDRDWPPKPGESCIIENAERPPAKPMAPENARELCREIKDEGANESCVFDLIATGEKSMATAYQRTLSLRALATP